MANQVLNNVRITVRNDTAANWASVNPVLMKGEIGLETDTNLFKFGDGTANYNNLDYANDSAAILFEGAPGATDWDYTIGIIGVDINTGTVFVLTDNAENEAVWEQVVTLSQLNEILSNFGEGDMLKSEFASNGVIGKVDHAVKADELSSNRAFTLTGDITGTVSSNLSGGVSIAATLATVLVGGAPSGLYKITVNAKGLVTAVDVVAAADIPNLILSKITDAGTAAALDAGAEIGNVVIVESTGVINPSLIPSIAIVDVEEFDTIAEMLDWTTAEQGDIAIVNLSTGVEVYILKGSDPSVLGNWVRLNIPTGAVVSVNGETGAVSLTTTNIPEGTNLYFTETRATDNFETNFALAESTGLADGNTLLRSTDTFVLNGGNASLA